MANQPFDVSGRQAGERLIRLGAGEHLIDANYQTMGNGHQSPFVTESRMELPVSRFELGVFGAGSGPGGLHHCRFHMRIALQRWRPFTDAGVFVIAGR